MGLMEKDAIQKTLSAALSTGGDYAELFFEDTTRNSLEYKDGRVETTLSGRDFGAGIRVLSGVNYTYAYTSDVSESGLVRAAEAAASAMPGAFGAVPLALTVRPKREMQPIKMAPSPSYAEKRAAITKEAHDAVRAHSTEIVQATSSVGDIIQNVIIANSEGLYVEDRRARSRFMVQAVAAKDGEMQTGYWGPGAGAGFEFYGSIDIEALSKDAAQSAITMLHAPFAPAGMMPAVIGDGFGGVIFHEACGHSLESARVGKNQSEFTGLLGEKIANSAVTAIDDGSMLGYWGSTGYDDEGFPTQKNVLIERGILKAYMTDLIGARRMGSLQTGNGRRQSYRYAPTSRMTNTYLAPGTDENLIKTMGSGLYAKKMGGGSVNPLTGEFNFAVVEGYLIKNGELHSPVRGATLIGKGSDVLKKIDMVGRDLALAEGMCGAESGSIPTCVGQPMIRVSSILVGGREAE